MLTRSLAWQIQNNGQLKTFFDSSVEDAVRIRSSLCLCSKRDRFQYIDGFNLSMSPVHGSKQPVHIFFYLIFSLRANHIMFASKTNYFWNLFYHIPCACHCVMCHKYTFEQKMTHTILIGNELSYWKAHKGNIYNLPMSQIIFNIPHTFLCFPLNYYLYEILLKTWCGSPINHSIDLSFIWIFRFITNWLCSRHSCSFVSKWARWFFVCGR